MKILIADDFAPVRNSVRRMLQSVKGVTLIAEAADGAEAEKQFRSLCPDVLVLDIHMPKKTGLELLDQIRNDLAKTVVIVLTNFSDHETCGECYRLGAHYVFDKTTEFEAMVDVVRDLVR